MSSEGSEDAFGWRDCGWERGRKVCDCVGWLWDVGGFSQDDSQGFEEGSNRGDAILVVEKGEDRAENGG